MINFRSFIFILFISLLGCSHLSNRVSKVRMPENLYKKGLACSLNEKYISALKAFDSAIDKNPDFTLAYYERGNVFCKIWEYENAIEDYSKILDLHP